MISNCILPAIMPQEFADIGKAVAKISGSARTVQIDIMDGIFVPVSGWPYHPKDAKIWGDLQNHLITLPGMDKIEYEFDLMVMEPENELMEWVELGPSAIVIHLESVRNKLELIELLKSVPDHIAIGLCIQNGTPLDVLKQYIGYADYIQLMGIDRLGYQGGSFDSKVLSVIEDFREHYPDLVISIDGAVNEKTLPLLVKAGANRFISGSYVFNSENPRERVQKLHTIVEQHLI